MSRALRARVGDLAIAVFDTTTAVCLVTGVGYNTNFRKFKYWTGCGDRIELHSGELPRRRLVRVVPHMFWNGQLSSLSVNNVRQASKHD